SWQSGLGGGDVQQRCEVAIIGDSGAANEKSGSWPRRGESGWLQRRRAPEKQKRGARPRFG
ncbi:hypothetical protein, partial [Thauera sp.]|uniref:hypothetical protein n=1 Tax=Thauera sp. TaxID=1905334 RepID=UPI00257E0454